MQRHFLFGLFGWVVCCSATTTFLYAAPAFEGMSYTAFGPSGVLGTTGSNASLLKMSQMGATTVALNTWWYQSDIHAISVASNYSGNSEPPSTIGSAIDYIHSLGMKVLFKPMLDSNDGFWRAYVNPSDPNTWFGYNAAHPYVNGSTTPLANSYGDYIGQMADIAQQHHADLFSVGCEMNNMEQYTANWQELISNVRARYTGKVTYSANWSSAGAGPDGNVGGGYNAISWWNKLDYVGVDAYFPLTNTNDPSETALQSAWTSQASTLHTWLNNYNSANSTNLKMLFTEVGYSSYRGTNKTPYQGFSSSNVLDTTEQANCYQALLAVMSQQSWWDGAFFWNWTTNQNGGGTSNKDFTPQNKPAQQVAAQFYLLRGDFNLDHRVTNADIQAMLDAARNISAYKSTYFFSDADMAALGDFNGDGMFNAADIQGELNFLTGNSSGGGSATPVPEPSTAILAALGLACCLARRKRSR
jgi:serralysin